MDVSARREVAGRPLPRASDDRTVPDDDAPCLDDVADEVDAEVVDEVLRRWGVEHREIRLFADLDAADPVGASASSRRVCAGENTPFSQNTSTPSASRSPATAGRIRPTTNSTYASGSARNSGGTS